MPSSCSSFCRKNNPGVSLTACSGLFSGVSPDYRALHGAPKEVFFAQIHRPGVRAQLDFTRIASLGVKVAGQPVERMLFECILCYSGRRHVTIVPSESYEALCVGVCGAFRGWNGVPAELGHDHMSAAIRNLKAEKRYEINQRYLNLLTQFGTVPCFIEVAKPNQNGCVERGHGVLKSALAQALKLRRSSDFESMEKFDLFLQVVVEKLNRKRQDRWEEERKLLRPLPQTLPSTYSDFKVGVSRWSLIQVKGNGYSVPSRLIGHTVNVRIKLETLEIYYKDNLVDILPRFVGRGNCAINYRHVIHSLIRKPGAFADYRYRQQMYPSPNFRRAYDSLVQSNPAKASIEYLRLLHQAATGLECEVEAALALLFETDRLPSSQAVSDMVTVRKESTRIELTQRIPDLSSFDELLTGEMNDQLVAA